jgi:hypothetical protein
LIGDIPVALYDQPRVSGFADIIKNRHPDIWKIVGERESFHGVYDENKSRKVNAIILKTCTGAATWLFLGIRATVSREPGINTYREAFQA